MKHFTTILLLVISNVFMTFAWYGHLKIKNLSWGKHLGLFSIILISWGLAFFEYIFQVPANKIGFKENGGPFSLVQLKILQEVITLLIFVVFTRILFQNEGLHWNHYVAFLLIIMAVAFVFYQ
jgi:uncharacterized protein (DUF486 family)